MTCHLAIFATHPVQYQVPIWRALASASGLELKVYYFSDHGMNGSVNADFGVPLAWDVPLLDGYEHEFITRTADLAPPNSIAIPNAEKVLTKGKYDWILVQGYAHRFERQVIRAARRLGIKVVIRGEFADHGKERGFFKTFARDRYLKWFYSYVDAFCYIGVEARQHLLRRGIPEEKLFFSPYSVDTVLFDGQKKTYDRTSCRAKLELIDKQFTFLFSGKLIPRKNPILLLEALGQLHDRGDVALIVLGDGPLRDMVIKWGAAALGSRFLFQGFVNQSQLGRYFLAADAFVLPSSYETWGLVVNEAMQFGLPVITSDHVNCHRDLVIQGDTGFVFHSGDKVALARALQRLSDDRRQAAKMGQNARRHIRRYSTVASVHGLLQAIGFEDSRPQ